MARCGRCGLWAKYPDDFEEKKYAGMCLWYRLRLSEESVWEHRKCDNFFDRVPQWDEKSHLDYALKWSDIGRSWRASRRAMFFSVAALLLSIVGLLLSLL